MRFFELRNGLLAGASFSDRHKQFWPRELVLGLLPLLIGLQLLMCAVFLPIALRGGADFRQLYSGGYMIRTGRSKVLYDYQVERDFETRLTETGAAIALPVNHLAYEELLFVPLSLLSYRKAFLLFFLVNLAILYACAQLLMPKLQVLSARWKLFPAFLIAAFPPIARTLVQGQDSILLLALLAGALVFETENPFLAGVLVGLGLFKFQIVLPIGLLFLLWKRWGFVAGFSAAALAAVSTSVLITGVDGMRQYASMLASMSIRLGTGSDASFHYATNPLAMLNIRGLLFATLGSRVGLAWLQVCIIAFSLALLLFSARLPRSLPLATITASLTSYHMLAHDASVLLIPAAIALASNSYPTALIAAAIVIAPNTALSPSHGYLGAIPPLLLLFLAFAAREFPEVQRTDRRIGAAVREPIGNSSGI